MNVSLHLSKLTFASGDTLSLAPDSIVLFVGPNSSGKTQSLKDLWNQITSPHRFRGLSIVDATLEKTGTTSQYLDFIRENSITHNNNLIMSGLNISPPDAANNDWKQEHPRYVGRVFAQLIEADERLSAIKERTRINRSEKKPIHPLQALDFDPDRERDTSNTFNNVFGQHLMLDRGAGSVVNLHVGTRPDSAAYGGEYSPEYASEVRKQPDISTEGDGLKAAAGLFLNILAIPKSIYLIDEPDVYLHPPQAYATAREMVNISNGRQLFMATHNAHFVRGLLDTNSERVVLVRLDRSTDIQSAKVIDTEVFRGIDADPLVRFSNLLEAIFFPTSIVCENEADCLFYRNLCRVVDPDGNDNGVFWLSAHGKQNIKKFVSLLRQLGLAVISLPDLDIINNQTNLRTLFESHGGTWADIEADFLTLARLMRERKPTVSAEDVATKIDAALRNMSTVSDELFPDDTAEEIRAVMRGASPWREVKESGISAFGKGKNRIAIDCLLDALQHHGVLAPPVGEMESFFSLSSNHGMAWVNDVLCLDIARDERLSEARKFGKAIIRARTGADMRDSEVN